MFMYMCMCTFNGRSHPCRHILATEPGTPRRMEVVVRGVCCMAGACGQSRIHKTIKNRGPIRQQTETPKIRASMSGKVGTSGRPPAANCTSGVFRISDIGYRLSMSGKIGAICRPLAANCTSGVFRISDIGYRLSMSGKVGAICRPPAANCTSGVFRISAIGYR